jgi:hypothetical protein
MCTEVSIAQTRDLETAIRFKSEFGTKISTLFLELNSVFTQVYRPVALFHNFKLCKSAIVFSIMHTSHYIKPESVDIITDPTELHNIYHLPKAQVIGKVRRDRRKRM